MLYGLAAIAHVMEGAEDTTKEIGEHMLISLIKSSDRLALVVP